VIVRITLVLTNTMIQYTVSYTIRLKLRYPTYSINLVDNLVPKVNFVTVNLRTVTKLTYVHYCTVVSELIDNVIDIMAHFKICAYSA
jgi:hypothetical protein